MALMLLCGGEEDPVSPLAIYLRNHEAGARAGLDMFERVAVNQRDAAHAGELRSLAEEIASDLDALHTLMRTNGVHPDHLQVLVARLSERAARLKPNGRVLRRAPLGDLIEVEALLDAVRAKAAGWHALAAAGIGTEGDGVDLVALRQRAQDQVERLTVIHAQQAASVLVHD